MKTIRLYFSLAVMFVLTITFAQFSLQQDKIEMSHVEAVGHVEKIETVNVSAVEEKPVVSGQKTASVEVVPEAQAETPAPKPEPVCGPADPAVIYAVLREIGVPRSSAIQQLGSWKHESGFDPCQNRGDGGIAWGLNSWHPARRTDMPYDLTEQIKWAVLVEMPRDCRSCYEQFMAGGDKWTIRAAIKKSTRWGIEGKRWYYADQFDRQFK